MFNNSDSDKIEFDRSSIGDEEVTVLEALGNSSTIESIQYSIEYEDRIEKFVQEPDLCPELYESNIESALSDLEKRKYVRYLGHGEWTVTDLGSTFVEEGGEASPKGQSEIQSSSLFHPNFSFLNLLVCAILLVLSVGSIFSLPDNTASVCQAIGPILISSIVIPSFLVIVVIHGFEKGTVLTRRIVNNIVNMDVNTPSSYSKERQEAYESQKFDTASRSMANTFRFSGFYLIPVILLIVSIIDFNSDISNQSYGLVLDAVGGIYLALEVLRTDRLGSSGISFAWADSRDETKTATDGAWGAFFLSLGFLMQFLSLLPWQSFFSFISC